MKMSESMRDFRIFMVGMLVLVVAFVAYINMDYNNQVREADRFGAELERAGITVLVGIVNSPSVIIVVDSPMEFMSMVWEHNQSIVYRGYKILPYYVFNDDMSKAWKYIPKVSN